MESSLKAKQNKVSRREGEGEGERVCMYED